MDLNAEPFIIIVNKKKPTFCNINNDINDNEINRQLNTISEWLLSNKLSLNIKKTIYMVFHTNQRRVLYPNLYLIMMKIERVTQFNFLGIVLSSNLKWNKHTDHTSKKISRAIGVMYRLKQIYPHAVLLTLYQAIHKTGSCILATGYWYGVLKLRMVIHCIYFKRRK